MAFYYLDTNGATAGFGTLNASVSASANFLGPVTLSATGTTTTTAGVGFTAAAAHSLSFGSPSGTATAGTLNYLSNNSVFFNQLWFQNVTGNQTIFGSTVDRYIQFVGTNPYCEVTANGKLILDVQVRGTINWEKRGSSTLQLLKANTFSGGMTIAAGTVEIGNASALGTGTVTMTGGKLSSSSTTSYSTANALTLNGTMTLGDSTNNGALTFSGTTTVSGTTTLTAQADIGIYGSFQGSGSLSLGGNNYFFTGTSSNTYSGALTLTSGGLLLASGTTGTPNQIASAFSISTAGQIYFLGGTGVTYGQSFSGAGTVSVYNPAMTFSGSWTSFNGTFRTYSDNFTGNTLPKATLSSTTSFPVNAVAIESRADNSTQATHTKTYTGTDSITTNCYWGHYAYSSPLISVFQHYGSTGTTINFGGSGPWVSNDSVNDVTLQYDVASGNTINIPLRFYEYSAGKFLLTKLGTGTLTLSGDNQISKAISVSAGTLNANSATALGSASSTAAISVTSGATLSLGAAPTYASRSLTISGTGVSSTVGALVIANTGTSAFQSITLGASGTYIRATNSGQINAPFTTNNNSVIFGASTGSDFIPFASLSNVFSGTGSVTYGSHSGDTGIVRADVRHTYTGNTTLAYGTTYVDSSLELASTGGPLGNRSLSAAGSLLMTGGTLSYLGGNVDYSGRFSTAGSQQWKIDASGKTVTFATALVGTSSLSLRDDAIGGNGSLTLSSASSTFSGGVTITSGTLYAGAAQSGVSGPLGITGTITFAPAGTGVLAYTSASSTFDYSSRFATTNGQGRRINVNGENVTFSTVLGGTNAFALVGSAGTLTLAAANAYTQGTTLSVGALKCSNVQSLGTGASAGLAQANNTTLHVATADGKMTIAGAHTNTGTGSRTIRIGAA